MSEKSDQVGIGAEIEGGEEGRAPVDKVPPADAASLLTFPAAPAHSDFTGERYLSEVSGPIQYEHYHRYAFARAYCAGKDVLDIASGEGYGSALLAGVAQSVVGVDIDEDAVAAAQQAFPAKNLRYQVGSCTAIPMPDASVDVIVSFETLEHFDGQEAFFDECKRVLRPGGVFIVSTPDKTVFSPPGAPPNPYHVKELTRAEFEALLSRYFADYELVGQAPLIGSAIVPFGDKGASLSYLEETKPRTYAVQSAINNPMYLIAVVGAKATPGLQLLNGAANAVPLFAQTAQKASFLENEIVRIHHEFSLRETEIARLNGVQAELHAAVQASDDRGGQLTRDAAALRAQIEEQNGVCQQLKAQLDNRSGQYEQLKAQLDSQNGRYEQLKTQIEQRRALTSRLQVENARLLTRVQEAAEAEQRVALVDAVQASSTWKIARALARLGRRVPAGGRRPARAALRLLARIYRSARFRMSPARLSGDQGGNPGPAAALPTAPSGVRPEQPAIDLLEGAAGARPSSDFAVVLMLDRDRWLLPETVAALRPAAQLGAEIIICSDYASPVAGAVSVVRPPSTDPATHLDQILRSVSASAAIVITDNLALSPESFAEVREVFKQHTGLAAVNGTAAPAAAGYDGVIAKTVRPAGWLQPGVLGSDLDVYALVGGLKPAAGDIGGSLRDYSQRCQAAGFTVAADPFLTVRPLEHEVPFRAPPTAKAPRARALICDLVTPTPDRDCGSLNLVWTIRILQSLGYECTFLTTIQREHAGRYTDELRRMGVHCVTQDEYPDFWTFIVDHGGQFDLAMLFRVACACHLIDGIRQFAPQARVVFSTVDVHFLREQRAAALANSAEMAANAEATKHEELRVMRTADASAIVSLYEMDLIAKLAPEAKTYWIPIVNPIAGLQSPAAGRAGVMFVGGFNHHPNIDAMLYFVTEVWPRVRELAPEAELYVIGSSPPPEVVALSTPSNGVKIVGFVENLGPWYRSMRVNIAPLRYGGGVKGKVISSLSVGLPTVATSMAVEGMGLTHELNVMVADEADAFAKAIAALCTDDACWNAMARESVEAARKIYSVEAISASLEAMLSDLDLPH